MSNFKKCVGLSIYSDFADNAPSMAVVEVTKNEALIFKKALETLQGFPHSPSIHFHLPLCKVGHCEEDKPILEDFKESDNRIAIHMCSVGKDGVLLCSLGEKHSHDEWETKSIDLEEVFKHFSV